MCKCKVILRVKPPKPKLAIATQAPTVVRACAKEAMGGDAAWSRMVCALLCWEAAT